MRYFIFQIKNSIEDFKRNKTRTLLASLGIMIGVLSVVMLIALGIGLKNYIKGQFENMGTNLIMVMPGSGFESGFNAGAFTSSISLDERDVNSLRRISDATYVVPVFFKSAVIESEGEEEFGYVMGINEEFFEVMNASAEYGSILTKSEVQGRSKNVVLGYSLADKLYSDPSLAVGKTIRFNNQRFKVIGVIEKKGDNELDGSVVMSYRTTYGSINPDKTFWSIYVGVNDEDKIESVKLQAEEALARRYDKDDFSVSEQDELLEVVNQIFNMVNGVLIAIGSISLVVGGIGIMNIMYANVTERTKEIGIRRAIGATRGDIMAQFLTESVLLSGFGGVMGLLVSALIVVLVHPYFPIALNFFAVVLAIGISTLIGVFFGVFPARRASSLTPIEAIRYE
ncbi:MAG: Macrolide export ATP-binding/permease protein MacB [Candidatus Woesebacteria bacterium GW2011_GWB1_43_14]|uniref:Macrolide export ATP-binding/permease protein MacB n=1 Tax=Candidatus Woesebacteria bacterium GW2011_GWB1_43_14 TaxID=1618578 RepID=A0A0G1DMX3_9BACT|nr:MAG: Macrolide export ATP-binding/permease protein MacB [Candidatus Woesebacteria bacterium GW2011_GWA1_39_11b]KKS78190.1 MAG: ABC transporter, permease protein [Candidatus Woesebacteria bacterium GW2011_GWC1_42_9]KKS98927.1 MAG: Macrolide export ATP-binding/permease protein MacB [Candidatus Woesebacteria bacterium GW2011_GWB1_43_14]